jgi:hypothetical protein
VAILLENVLTVANIGDGLAHLDTGADTVELTVDHRLEVNEGEGLAWLLEHRYCCAASSALKDGVADAP